MSLQEIRGSPFQKKMSSQPSIKEPSPKKPFTKKDNPLQRIINRNTFTETPPSSDEEQQTITEPTPLSKQQVQTQTGRNWLMGMRESILTREKTRMLKGRINPEEQYVMQEEGPSWSKGQILTGTQVMGLYDTVGTEQSLSSSRYLRGTGQLLRTVSNLPAGSLFYPEDTGFIVATPAAQETLGFYKSRGYQPPGGDIGFYRSPPSPTDVLYQVKGETSGKIAMASLSVLMPFAVPFNLIAQHVTGEPYLERYGQSQASRVLELMPGKGEMPSGYLPRQLSSPEVIFGVYLPMITLGASTAVGYLGKGLTESVAARYLSYLGSKNVLSVAGKSLTVGGAIKVGMGVGIGGYTGLQIYQHPEETPTILGNLASVLTINYAAAVGGASLGKSLAYKPGMNWTGTPYEGYVADISRRGAILESQYRPYEWGSPSTHYSTVIQPSYAKTPYIPKHPADLHTTTVGLKNTDFMLSKVTVSSNMGDVIVRTPIKVDVGDIIIRKTDIGTVYAKGKDLTIDFFTGKTISKGKFGETFTGFSTGTQVGEFQDFTIMRGYGKTFLGSDSTLLKFGAYPDTITSQYVSLSKSFPGTRTPTKFGLGPEGISYDYAFTKSYSTMLTNIDNSFIFSPRIKTGSFIKKGRVMDFIGGGDGAVRVSGMDVSMPGGIGDIQTSVFTDMSKLGGFPKFISGTKQVTLSEIESLEYGIQSSSYWTGKQTTSPLSRTVQGDVLSSISLKSVLSRSLMLTGLNMRTLSMQRTSQGLRVSSVVLSKSMQASDVLNISAVASKQVSLTKDISLFTPVSVPSLVSTVVPVFNIVPVTAVPVFDVPYVPFIPIIPWGGKTSGEGGGYGGGRRKKKGARRRTHPTELYDLLQVKVAI